MKKLFKYLLIAAGIFAVLAFAAVLTLKKMFPPEKIKGIITAKISENLGREARLGAVDVGLIKGIQIHDFAVSEYPDFKAGTFLETKNFTLKINFWPLLQKKLAIDKVILDSPQITVIRNADGKTFNFSTLMKSPPAKADAPKAPEMAKDEGPKSVSLTISQASLINGKIEFVDKSPEKIKLDLNPINLTVTGTELDKPMALDFSLKAAGNFKGKSVNASVALKCVVDALAQRVNIENLSATLAELSLDLKGKVQGFAKPDLDVSVSLKDFDFKQISRWASLPKELSLSGSPAVNLSIKGLLTSFDCDLEADFSKMDIGYSGAFAKSGSTPMTLAFSGNIKNQNDIDIKKLSLKLSGFEPVIKGSVKNIQSGNPVIKIELGSGPFDIQGLAGMISAAKNVQPSGKIGLKVSAQGTPKALTYSGGLNLSGLGALVDKYSIEGVSGDVSFTENQVEISKLAGKMGVKDKGSSDFDLSALVKNFSNPDITLNANFQTLDLGMFMSDEKKKEGSDSPKDEKPASKTQAAYKGPVIKTQGQVKIAKLLYPKFDGQNTSVSWKLAGVTPILDKINGTADFQMGNGKINKIPLLATIAPILHSDPSALAFTKMGGHMNFTNGTGRTDDFQINSPVADLYAKGTVYLPTSLPDMTLTAKLPKGSLGGTMAEFSNDAEGRPTFAFKMKGSWKPVLDTSQMQKKAVEKATDEIKKKAADVLQNEGKKLLEGIFKR